MKICVYDVPAVSGYKSGSRLLLSLVPDAIFYDKILKNNYSRKQNSIVFRKDYMPLQENPSRGNIQPFKTSIFSFYAYFSLYASGSTGPIETGFNPYLDPY
jgi:hypothetical protein